MFWKDIETRHNNYFGLRFTIHKINIKKITRNERLL